MFVSHGANTYDPELRLDPGQTGPSASLLADAEPNNPEIAGTYPPPPELGQAERWTNHRSATSDLSGCASLSGNMMMRPSRDMFYMGFWENQCAPSLHPVFGRIARKPHLPEVVTRHHDGTCSSPPQSDLAPGEESGSLDIIGSSFRPDMWHQTVSDELSGSAMRIVARWTREEFELPSATTLAVLVLFCHLESLMSNFQAFYLHSAAVESLIGVQGDMNSRSGDILAAWIQSKMHNWWRRFHFGTPAFQIYHPPCSYRHRCHLFWPWLTAFGRLFLRYYANRIG